MRRTVKAWPGRSGIAVHQAHQPRGVGIVFIDECKRIGDARSLDVVEIRIPSVLDANERYGVARPRFQPTFHSITYLPDTASADTLQLGEIILPTCHWRDGLAAKTQSHVNFGSENRGSMKITLVRECRERQTHRQNAILGNNRPFQK